jgi:DNA-binding XRE family transcriptional regulator
MTKHETTVFRMRHKFTHVKIEVSGPAKGREQRELGLTISRKIAEIFGFTNPKIERYPWGWLRSSSSSKTNRDWLDDDGINFTQAPSINTPEEQIGFGIRTRRLSFNLTQEAFARQVGINRSHLSQIERGRCHVRPETLARIEAVFAQPETQHAPNRL